MTIYELRKTLEQRCEGLSYRIWKKGMLSQLLEKYPDTPKEASPELDIKLKPKKIAMPDFLKKKWLKQKGVKV